MRAIKAGMHISVKNPVDCKLDGDNAPVLKYQHAKVTEVHPTYVLCSVKGGDLIYAIRNIWDSGKANLFVWD